MQLCLRVSVYVSLKSLFLSHKWLMVWSWCGENSCPPVALILGMLEGLSVPLPATRRGLYPGLLRVSPTVVSVRSYAWKSLLSGVWNPWVCIAVWRILWELGLCICVGVCVSVRRVCAAILEKQWLIGISAKAQICFIIKVCHRDLSLNSPLSFLSLSTFNEYAFVMCEYVCV